MVKVLFLAALASFAIGVMYFLLVQVRLGRIEGVLQLPEQRFGLAGVVLRIAADVHIQRHVVILGPSVQRQMRLCQHHHAGDSTPLAKAVKQAAHRGQPGLFDGLQAEGLDGCRVEHQAVVAIATVQVADQMQAGCLARHMGGSGAGRLAEKGMS